MNLKVPVTDPPWRVWLAQRGFGLHPVWMTPT
jgi:hypothetical protein